MRYVDLTDESGGLGRFIVPAEVISDDGQTYFLEGATWTGGNGVVFAAREQSGSSKPADPRAVKILKLLNRTRRDRFTNEIRVLKELDSPYISKFFAAGQVAVIAGDGSKRVIEAPWLAMQLGGQNMRAYVYEKGPLTLELIKGISFGLCSALEHIHSKGYIHRDIKPENFVWRSAGSTAPMMIDFGIAKRAGEDVSMRPMDSLTRVAEFVGPAHFSSPELIAYAKDKTHPVDYRSDIFQLGKVLWFLATGKVSAGVPSRRECPANGRLRELVIGMVDDDPEMRPQTLGEVRDRLNAI